MNKDEVCIFCLETMNENENTRLIKYNDFLYDFNCKCVFDSHVFCLQQWINKSQNCPICVKPLLPKMSVYDCCSNYFESPRVCLSSCCGCCLYVCCFLPYLLRPRR